MSTAGPTAVLSPQALVFLADCKDHPDDDTPRLIFADWLEEQGDPRGEFVRLQCQLARLPLDDPRRPAWLSRERALLARYRSTWLGPLREPTWRSEFVRGLVRLTHPLSSSLQRWPGPEAFAWVEELSTLPVRKTVPELAGWPGLAQLRSLVLRHSGLDDNAIAILVASPHLSMIQVLDLDNNRIGPVGAHHLSSAPSLKRLRRLELSTNPLGDVGVSHLAMTDVLSELTALGLARTGMSAVGAMHLARSPLLAKRLRLNVYGNDLTPSSVAALEARFGEEVYW